MAITYRDTQDFTPAQLEALFLSVGWSSGKYPDKLQIAMKNSHSVFSAWDGAQLVGLINCLSDGIMTAYFHYLLVHADYHDQGIGRTLVTMMLERYSSYARKVLIATNPAVGFYERCGFEVNTGATPVQVTYLTT